MTEKDFLKYALNHRSYGEMVVVSDLRSEVIGSARAKLGPTLTSDNGTEPANEDLGTPAYIKVAVDDNIVMSLNGPPEKSPVILFLVGVPTQVYERAQSRIVLPGD